MTYDLVIIGGGLSGLALARHAQDAGLSWTLLEARERLGGRIYSAPIPDDAQIDQRFDLGPAWFWKGQPRIADLIERLGLPVFQQYASGNLTFEDQSGQIKRDLIFNTAGSAFRIEGGMEALIKGLSDALPKEYVHTGKAVKHIKSENAAMHIDLKSGGTIIGKRVALALPPRVAARSLRFTPEFPKAVTDAMIAIPTWMAGHAKILAVYDTPFWRQKGLSGNAISHRGPMMEIHDASPKDASVGALFGFVGTDAQKRLSMEDEQLLAIAKAQLARLFGDEARAPKRLILQDWAKQPETATSDDLALVGGHPDYGLPQQLANLADGRLLLASTEVASTMGGYLEGALTAAAETIARVLESQAKAA